MAYKRAKYRAPRQVEETRTTQERDTLRMECARLAVRNAELARQLRIRELEVEHLLEHKIRLALELKELRTQVAFLFDDKRVQGKLGAGNHYGFKRFLAEWKP